MMPFTLYWSVEWWTVEAEFRRQQVGWIRKLVARNPQFQSVWNELAEHADGKVRFRSACFLDDRPKQLAIEIGGRLRADPSRKVREMAMAKLEEISLKGQARRLPHIP